MIVCQVDGEEKRERCLIGASLSSECDCPEIYEPQPVPAMTDADLRAEILYAMTRLGNVLKVLEERDRR